LLIGINLGKLPNRIESNYLFLKLFIISAYFFN